MVPAVRITDTCPICPARQPDEDNEERATQLAGSQMAVIEGGRMLAMRKDPRFMRFQSWTELPSNELPEDTYVTVLFTHYDCFVGNCGSLQDDIAESDDRDSRHCDACRRCLDLGHKVYQVTIWCPAEDVTERENGGPEFVLDATCEKLILCPGCIQKILGEGDETEGDAILQEGVK
ncbi:hypothetical protein UFOVP276_74 [uncultured Caudovirales phage]|uniref:Uncharacterized protein n=1 Tax=uncultured Caudovirales phage TaxID=2100421 RepID=A0A6J5LC74_9CAUD|nr:hypothetical protein UFOVP127_211 [uncultured Caudovirales phage]CAB4135109.1 hypothetical protein UFOVP276_74 [uncultured Caudovirales phage]